MWEWTIVQRNDRMGFTKTHRLLAETPIDAMLASRRLLDEFGYNNHDFMVIDLKRNPKKQ